MSNIYCQGAHSKPFGVVLDFHLVFTVRKIETVFAEGGVQHIDLVLALLRVDRTYGTVGEVDKLYGDVYLTGCCPKCCARLTEFPHFRVDLSPLHEAWTRTSAASSEAFKVVVLNSTDVVFIHFFSPCDISLVPNT